MRSVRICVALAASVVLMVVAAPAAPAADVTPPSLTIKSTVDENGHPLLPLEEVEPTVITAEAGGPSGFGFLYQVEALDTVGPVSFACENDPPGPAAPSGGPIFGKIIADPFVTFPLGTTTVTCVASDGASPPNTTTKSFVVTVVDRTAPELNVPPDITREATGPNGALVVYEATATDLVDGTRPVSCTTASGATFPIGTTTVTCVASDGASPPNTTTKSFDVTVSDGTAPTNPGDPHQSVPVPQELGLGATPPGATPPLAAATLPVKVSWTPATDTVGVAKYQLSTDGGINWTDVTSVTNGSSVSATIALKMGQLLPGLQPMINSYTLRVRALDKAGNHADSPLQSAPTFQLLPVDDTLLNQLLLSGGARSPNVNYDGNWKTQALTGAYNNSVHFANDQGARARLDKATFQVTSGNAAWVSTKRPDGGIAEVFVDGIKKDTVDLWSASIQPVQVVWALNGVTGTHTVVVQLTGTKNTHSAGTRVDLDAFVLLR